MTADLPESPVPLRASLQEWLHALEDQVAAGKLSHRQLVELLGQTRRASRDLGWVADYLALRAREEGASFPDLAVAWSTRRHRSLVNGPRMRIQRLTDRFGSAENLLAALDQLDSLEENLAPGQGE